MADDSLKTPVRVSAIRISASTLPIGLSPTYRQYILSQALDFTKVADKANEAGKGAYDAQVKNDEQDVILADHEQRLDAAEATLANHEIRITAAEATLVNHETRITQNTNDIAALTVRMVSAESAITSLQTNVANLTTRVTTAEGNITTLQSGLTALTTRVTTAEGNITTLQSSVAAIQTDYVSKSETANQTVQPVSGSLLVGTVATPTADKLQVTGSVNVSVSYKVAGTQVVSARKTGWTASTGIAYRGAFNADQAWTIGILDVVQIQAIATALTQARQRIKALEDDLRSHGLIN